MQWSNAYDTGPIMYKVCLKTIKNFRTIFELISKILYSHFHACIVKIFFNYSLVSLDASYSLEVTDFGIQNLIFPPTIISNRGNSNAGMKVNLTNTRARTSQIAKLLQVKFMVKSMLCKVLLNFVLIHNNIK